MMEDDNPFRLERQGGGFVEWHGPLPDPEVARAEAAALRKAARTRRAKGVKRSAGGPVGSVRFCAAVARRVCERVEMGESLRALCADPKMPHRGSVTAWRKKHPVFAARLERARTAAGWHFEGGRKPLWCPQLAREICARLAEGEPLTKICSEPEMPSLGVVYTWRAARADFAGQLRLAREVRAERLCDEGWEIACAVTPETAHATRVKLGQLRWMTAYLAPRRFGRFKAVEAEVALEAAATAVMAGQPTAILVKHFKVEERADGALRTVTFVLDPRTNSLVRLTPEDAPWGRPPPGNFRPARFPRPMEPGGA